MQKCGGERVARADGVRNFNRNGVDLDIFGALENRAAALATGDADGVPMETSLVIAAEALG
jgi:hypothetical protein